jgi:hypothetical protein
MTTQGFLPIRVSTLMAGFLRYRSRDLDAQPEPRAWSDLALNADLAVLNPGKRNKKAGP